MSNYRLSSKSGQSQFNPEALEYVPRSVTNASHLTESRQSSSILPSSKVLELLETSEGIRDKLEADVKKAKMDRRIAETNFAVARGENKVLRKEVQELTDDAETARMYTEDLRRRFKEVVRQNEMLVADVEKAKSTANKHAARIKELEKEKESLETKVAKLEIELKVKEPVFQVGVDVRTRYLEQAKESFWHVKTFDKISNEYFLKKYTVDQVAIEKGNQAAYGGNGTADGALFVLGKLSRDWATKETKHESNESSPYFNPDLSGGIGGYGGETSEPEPSNIFEELYHYRPSIYATLPSKMLEVINYEATIKTLKSLNDGLDRPLQEKQQALENISVVLQKYPKLPRDEFDTDAEVSRRVERVKALTEIIVQYDRKKNGKTREGRRADSSYQFSGESLI
ncbi:hypothetical protein VTL71DRAFT_8634 [Oculimacula yallundae]|uniref:Uncharacterized protein n=1 Tax=Oculimacula yallundae TaxID=86028 RepID=A0ABR4CY95_9HELO